MLIVHCSATAEGKDYTEKDIDRWHRAQGWAGCGYHYVIRLDGTIETGRDLEKAGAHCQGYNAHSIGICYIGGLAKDGKTPKDTRTAAQKDALVRLLKLLKASYPDAKIYGHRDFAKKACPCFNARQEYRNI